MKSLYWLPQHQNFREALSRAKQENGNIQNQLRSLRHLASHDLDFTKTTRVDRRLQNIYSNLDKNFSDLPRIKLAILASSTVDHLPSGIRVAALRRGLIVDIYLAPYNQYRQEILNRASQLYTFNPDVVLIALDNQEVGIKLSLAATAQEVTEQVEQRVEEWVKLWDVVTNQLNAVVIQQTMVIPVEQLFGQYDAMIPATTNNILFQLNQTLRMKAAVNQILLFDVDALAASVGKQVWCDRPLWYHSKQDISPVYSPLYGEKVACILAAIRGLSRKCLVLDLDNTLWGGVIGDDGLGGIELGQGSGLGEAFQGFQGYVKQLKERGIILAVCSKNDESNALEPFAKHPEMILSREDISIFVANWEDKATNIERIATELNIGLDSLVFFDDNPVERGIVRQFVPVVAVPEVPEDPAWYTRCLSDAGYFEAIAFSQDDWQRTEQYLANSQRKKLEQTAHSIDSFLEKLNMKMTVAPVDTVSLARTTQLINKSNQFNLTTRRYTESQIKQMCEDPNILCLQVRLKDNFGDNGIISVIIAKPAIVQSAPLSAIPNSEEILHIDTWLMSCRVLGRQVEQALLNILSEQAHKRGYHLLEGEYISTKKNSMVEDHYQRLGFDCISKKQEENGTLHSIWQLNLSKFVKLNNFIESVFIA